MVDGNACELHKRKFLTVILLFEYEAGFTMKALGYTRPSPTIATSPDFLA